MEAVTRSPVYAMFSAIIKGLPTIRAFRTKDRFRKTFVEALDVNGAWLMGYQVANRCLLIFVESKQSCTLVDTSESSVPLLPLCM